MNGIPNSCKKITVPWTADGSGNATVEIGHVAGTIVTVSGTHDSASATDPHAITITDELGIDVMGGGGASLVEGDWVFCPAVDFGTDQFAPRAVDDVLTLNVSGAVAASTGTVCVYVR